MANTKDVGLHSIKEYSADEFVQLSWEEYGQILERLYLAIKKYTEKHPVKFDAIVPVLRGGMIPAAYLCGKLKIIQVIPIQFKYFINGNNVVLKRLLPLAKGIDLGENPNILIVENCYCFGETTKAAIRDIKKEYPDAKLYVAADRIDYSYKDLEDIEAVFWGDLDNDTKELSTQECKKLGIDPTQYYYPWETLDEEIAACTLEQFNYQDIDKAVKRGEEAVLFDLEKGTVKYEQ